MEAQPLSSMNLDFKNPLSVNVVFGSKQTKSPGRMPRASTSSLLCTISSMRTAMFWSSLGRVEASGKTWIAGDRDRIVPVYIFPSIVWILQYSPSRVGRIGEPTAVIIRWPSAVIERTIRPSVSICADRATGSSSVSPSTGTITLPRLLR